MSNKRAVMGRVLRWIAKGLVWVAAGLLVLAGGVVAYEYAAAKPEAEERRAAEAGRATFLANCAACHGVDLLGHVPKAPFNAPPLRKPGFAFYFYTMPKDMEGFLAGLIGTGRGQMPAFQGVLTAEQRAALAAYLRQVNTGGGLGP